MRIFPLYLINTCLIVEHLRNLMIEEIRQQSSGVMEPSGSFRAICSHVVIVAQVSENSLFAKAQELCSYVVF